MAMALPNAQPANEILPGLWLGSRHAALDDAWLKSHQIGAVFNCSKDIPFVPGQRSLFRIPVDDNLQDDEIRNLELWSWEIVYKISKELSQGKKVLVHCAAGMQRSAASVAMFLISQFRCTTDEAIAYVKSRRPIAFFGNANFYRSIKGFETSFFRMIQEKGIYDKMPKRPLPVDFLSQT
jgi:dual specificity phosphatase 12